MNQSLVLILSFQLSITLFPFYTLINFPLTSLTPFLFLFLFKLVLHPIYSNNLVSLLYVLKFKQYLYSFFLIYANLHFFLQSSHLMFNFLFLIVQNQSNVTLLRVHLFFLKSFNFLLTSYVILKFPNVILVTYLIN